MNRNAKQSAVKLVLVIFTLFVINMSLYPRIILNCGDESFENPNPDGRSVTIQSCIINGAGYYMKSYSDILLFLQEIEWSNPGNVNYDELKTIINRALDNMKNAEGAYSNLEELANNTPYNPVFIEKLTAFDYRAFQQARAAYGIDFIVTRIYLSAGDVRGMFAHIKSGTGQVLNMLREIKAALDAEKFPELSSLWRLNRKASEIMLTGQYAAEIFYEIKGIQ
jgi:hypothetical protein